MNTYQYIIAGAGAAGLSLAYQLTQKFGADTSILLVDRSAKDKNDRTWCFWQQGDPPFSQIISHTWSKLCFADVNGEIASDISPWSYHMIRGIDFYHHLKTALAQCPGVNFLQANVEFIRDRGEQAELWADGKVYTASYVFNSCYRPAAPASRKANHHFMWQDFYGWRLQTDRPVFTPDRAMLMDFRAPQGGETRFFYILPFSEKEALVEHTSFGKEKHSEKLHREALKGYLKGVLDISNYQILETEQGSIPMTDAPMPAVPGERIVPLGTLGGAVKPTTGYAFLRIQNQVEALVEALAGGQSPRQALPVSGQRFRFYDTLLLNILSEESRLGRSIFSSLFRRNRLPDILRFLGEKTHLGQEARIFSTLPIIPFLKAVLRTRFQQQAVSILEQPIVPLPKKVRL